MSDKKLINEKINKFSKQKSYRNQAKLRLAVALFKNPKDKKAWQLIKNSNCSEKSFGKASISSKHSNFFVNEGGASSEDIEKLINFVRKQVLEKQNIKLDLEIKIIGEKLFMRKKILVVLGGNSRERSISIKTGEACFNSLRRQGYKVAKFDPKYKSFFY